MKIVISFEHVEREYLFALILKSELTKAGHKVLISNLFFDLPIIKFFKPDILMIPYFYSSDDKSIKEYIKISSVKQIISLSWEQIFNDQQKLRKFPRDIPKNLHFVSWSLSWAKALERSGVSKKQVIHLGHPLWSLYWNFPFRSYSYRGEKKNSKLYIENIGWLNSSKNTYSEDYLSGKEIGNLKQIFEAIHEVFKTFNAKTFKIKVRPSSTSERDFNLEKTFKHSKLVGGLPLIHYLRSSTQCFGDFSSALIDATILGVPSYGIGIDKIPQKLRFSWHTFFKPTKDIQGRLCGNLYEFDKKSLFNYLIRDGFISRDYSHNFLQFIASLNGQYSSKKDPLNINFILSRILLVSYHFLVSSKPFRKLIYDHHQMGLDIKTHKNDFISFTRYVIYKSYSLKLRPFL